MKANFYTQRLRAAIAYGRDENYGWRAWLWVRDAWHLLLFLVAWRFRMFADITQSFEVSEVMLSGPWFIDEDDNDTEFYCHKWKPLIIKSVDLTNWVPETLMSDKEIAAAYLEGEGYEE